MNMPQIEVIAPNATRVSANGNMYLFSYNTCVAAVIDGRAVKAATDKSGNNWSNTTKRHLSGPLHTASFETLTYAEFEGIVAG